MLYRFIMGAICCFTLQWVSAQDKIEFHMFKSGDSLRVAMNNSTILYSVFVSHDSEQIYLFDTYSADTFSIYKDKIYQVTLLKAVDNTPLNTPTKNPETASNSAQVEILLKDGNIFRGTIVKSNKDYLVITSPLFGEASIHRKQIIEIKYLNQAKSTNNRTYKNLSNKYLITPSAINLKKGESYYQNTYLFLQTFNIGITDYFSISATTEISSLLSGYPIFMIAPKFGTKVSENSYVGGGVIIAGMGPVDSWGDEFYFNFIHGTYTYGDEDGNITVNAGFLSKDPSRFLFSISGFKRITSKFGLVTDNFIMPSVSIKSSPLNVISIGGRMIGRRHNLDLAVFTIPDIISIVPLPYVSYAYRF
jgi:hypothetical protein